MFADNTVLFLKGFHDQFEKVFAILEEFDFFSGFRINLSTSQAFFCW